MQDQDAAKTGGRRYPGRVEENRALGIDGPVGVAEHDAVRSAVHPPPFGGPTGPDRPGGDPVEPSTDDGLGADLVSRAGMGIVDHYNDGRLEHDHGDGVDRAAAVGDEGAILLDACHGD